MKTIVAALYVRADSVYKSMPNVDAWDESRDARQYSGPHPVVAHPPCRLWGCLKHFSTAPVAEKALAHCAVKAVREFGGILEHPRGSSLWREAHLPPPGEIDQWGGHSIMVEQFWWGHKAEKKTLLYIVGCPIGELPTMPVRFGEPTHVIARPGRTRKKLKPGSAGRKPWVSKAEREHTPPAFAAWLVELARRCKGRSKNPTISKSSGSLKDPHSGVETPETASSALKSVSNALKSPDFGGPQPGGAV